MTKVCSSCRQEKPLEEFHRNAGGRGGVRSDCSACHNAVVREWGKTRGRRTMRESEIELMMYLRRRWA